MRFDIARLFVRFAWAGYLFSTVLLYLLGVGIAQYLGARLDPLVFLMGLLFIASLVMFAFFSYRYFDLRAAADNLGTKIFSVLPWRTAMLSGVVVAGTMAAYAAFMLLREGVITQGILILLLFAVIGVYVYTVPPVRLANSGYGELLLSVMVGAVIPALGFMLQFGGYQRYLAMIASPITALHLAMLVALNLPGYASQQKYEVKTLVTRMGWENAMVTHNLLILGAFLLIAVAALFDFPRFAFYPTLLAFPLGILQVYYMLRIAGGMKPNWNALSISTVSLFALPIYFLALAFWTH